MSTPPKLDVGPVIAWLDDVIANATHNGERYTAEDLRGRLLRMSSEISEAIVRLPAMREQHLANLAEARRRAEGHEFTPSPRLCGRCAHCEGYREDHRHKFVQDPRWSQPLCLCGDKPDTWAHTGVDHWERQP